MNFEVLRKSHLKRNIIIGVVVIVIISAIILNFTRAKYRTTQSIPLVNGTINYTPYDFKMVAMYQENDNNEYEEINIMPSSGYVINEELSYCTVDNVNKDTNAKLSTNSDGEHIITNLQKGSKCYLYFDKIFMARLTLNKLGLKVNNDIPNFNNTAQADCSDKNNCEETNGLYLNQEDEQISYYFRGSVNNNWVKFANFYWRIIKINNNGSLKLMFYGSDLDSPGLGYEEFNNFQYSNNAYVGYMYTDTQQHGLDNSSNIKTFIDKWFADNLLEYLDKIEYSEGFCGDREVYSGTGIGSNTTYYNGYNRLVNNKMPTFKCANNDDLYTTQNADNGNKALSYPVGLITADEVVFAGAVAGVLNSSFYMYTGEIIWTMTPFNTNSLASLFIINYNGNLEHYTGSLRAEVHPVINLKADITISSGDGTSSNPFVIAA